MKQATLGQVQKLFDLLFELLNGLSCDEVQSILSTSVLTDVFSKQNGFIGRTKFLELIAELNQLEENYRARSKGNSLCACGGYGKVSPSPNLRVALALGNDIAGLAIGIATRTVGDKATEDSLGTSFCLGNRASCAPTDELVNVLRRLQTAGAIRLC